MAIYGPHAPSAVVLAEHDGAWAGTLVRRLRRDGFRVFAASREPDARALVARTQPNVVIVDDTADLIDAERFNAALQEDEHGVPVLVVADEVEQHGQLGLAANGAPQLAIAKESRIRDLLTAARVLVRQGKRPEPDAGGPRRLRLGDIEVDLHRREARKDRKLLTLRPKEYELLVFLLRNQGRVIGLREITDALWDGKQPRETRSPYVHIRWLREKIEDDPGAPRYLRTVWGEGYIFDVPQTPRRGRLAGVVAVLPCWLTGAAAAGSEYAMVAGPVIAAA